MTASQRFTHLSAAVARLSGKPVTFALSVLVVVLWAATGPLVHYSDTWQLVINTGTTVVIFLMVFLIQNTQNRDDGAIQAKLGELIRASAAQNLYIGIEHLTEEELDDLRTRCEARAKAAVVADRAEEKAHRKAKAAADAAS